MSNFPNDMLPFILPSPIQEINLDVLSIKEIRLFIKREDLIHPWLSGNKYRKLKYNLLEAESLKNDTIITFGGVFSNHLFATAGACSLYGLKSTGIVRGEIDLENPTLKFCISKGMELIPIPRSEYRNKNDSAVVKDIIQDYDNAYLIPEGGTNPLAVLGCQEILTENDKQFDFICCCVGTGGTISGLINSSELHQKIIGFPALKGDFLMEEIRKFAANDRWELIDDYIFGGYAKISSELVDFMNSFFTATKIPLDPIYTGKMVFGVINLIRKNYFPKDSKILMIHTGGLQGIDGMNMKLQKQNSPILLKDV